MTNTRRGETVSEGTAYRRLIGALEEHGQKGSGNRWQCPGHDDTNPSLGITDSPDEGRVLVICRAGCETEEWLGVIGLTMADLFDNDRVTYAYEDGRRVHRFPGKKFTQSGNTKGNAVLYRRERVYDAVAKGQIVYVVEGEADVHAIERAGGVGTCAPMGAGKWDKVDDSPLAGAVVVVVQDKDEPGRKHAGQVVESLRGTAKAVRVVEAREGKDASDHLDHHGHGLADFESVELPGRWARVTWASEIEPEPVVWAWRPDGHGRIPAGAMTLAAGREGTGKSSFGIWMAAQISRGTLPGEFFGRPRRVLYVAVEDSWQQTIVPRLMAAEANLSMVGRFDVVASGQDVTLSLPSDNSLLERIVMDEDVAAVVIDPLMSSIGQGIDTHVERDVRGALDPLAGLAMRTGLMLLGIAHFNKGSGSDLNNLITGSGAFKNVARAVLGFAADEQGGVMSQSKNSLGRADLPSLGYAMTGHVIETSKGRAETARFMFTGESDRSVRDVLRDAKADREDQSDRYEAREWLVSFLAGRGGEAEAAEVYKQGRAQGFAQDVLKRAKKGVATSEKAGFGAGWVWRLDYEGSTKGAKGAGGVPPPPSLPSAFPSANCEVCGQELLHPESKKRGTCERCRRITNNTTKEEGHAASVRP
jgi:5S rRNA maturation endonuclease (ribonuclease M5)